MPPYFHPLSHISSLHPDRPAHRGSRHCRTASAERIPPVALRGPCTPSTSLTSLDSDSSLSHLPTSPSPSPSLTSSSSSSSSPTFPPLSSSATPPLGHVSTRPTKPTARPRMARFRHYVCAAAMVLGLLGEHGVGKIGIVGVGARAVPYTGFEEHVGRSRSPWAGERMREVEGLRVRGVSEKEIAAHFSTPHPRTLAYPHLESVTARAAEPESGPAVEVEGDGAVEKGLGIQERDAPVVASGQGEVLAREEMKTWLESRGVDVGAVNGAGEKRDGVIMAGAVTSVVATEEGMAEERGNGEELVERAEGVKGAMGPGIVKSVISSGEVMAETRDEEDEILKRADGAGKALNAGVVKSVISSGEAMAEKRGQEDEEEAEERPQLQVQQQRASEAEEAVRKVLDEWRHGLERRSSGVVVATTPPNARRSANTDAENGGLEVRGQMGGLKAVQV